MESSLGCWITGQGSMIRRSGGGYLKTHTESLADTKEIEVIKQTPEYRLKELTPIPAIVTKF